MISEASLSTRVELHEVVFFTLTAFMQNTSEQSAACHLFHASLYPAIRVVFLRYPQLQIIIRDGFGVPALEPTQSDGLNRFSDKRAHECQLLLCRQLTQHPVALASGPHRNLHRNVGVLGYAGRLGDQTNQLIAPVHRLDGAEAEFLKRGLLEETSDEINKSLRCSLLSH